MDELKGTLINLAKSAREALEQYHKVQDQKWREKQKEISEANFHQACQITALQLQEELAHILVDYGSSRFEVNTIEDVHFCNYRSTLNGVLYTYQVYAPNQLGVTLLRLLKDTLNERISNNQSKMVLQYGYENAYWLSPCIVSGMYIMDISENGNLIRFQVATHYVPQ